MNRKRLKGHLYLRARNLSAPYQRKIFALL
jgi:hypothetical protein